MVGPLLAWRVPFMSVVQYVGSPYHKRYPSRWGAPTLQSDKTECPPEIDPEEVLSVLPEAIEASIPT
jgi:hypothetical protein